MAEIDVSMCCFYWAGGCEEGGLTKKCSDRNCYYKQLQQLKQDNEELKDTIKEMEDDLDDWISDVSILYTYDDGKPNNLDELQCCMEHVHEEWSKDKQCLDEIEEICKTTICDYPMNKIEEIIKLIKQVKKRG